MATGLLPLIAGKIRSMVDEPIPTVSADAVQPQPMPTQAPQQASMPPLMMYPQTPSSEETGVGLFDSGRQQIQWRPEEYDYSRLKTGGAPSGLQGFLSDPENLANLALGFNSMRLQPDQGLAQVLGQRIKYAQEQRKESAAKNATVDALRQMGLEEGELKLLANNPELLKVAATAMYKKRYGGDITAEIQTWNALTKGLSDADQEKARRIKLGLDPRAAPSLSISPELLAQRALYERLGTKAGEARAEDIATAQKRIELKGQFDYLFGNLRQALGATSMTGPILGNLPSMTTADQIVDHAISMLQEPLKNVSRGKGEGTFTEGDAKVLLNMMPTRGMTTEAAARSLDALMQFINLKLQNPTLNLEEFFKNLPTTSSIAREASSGAGQSANPQVQSTPAPQSQQNQTSARPEADRILQRTR